MARGPRDRREGRSLDRRLERLGETLADDEKRQRLASRIRLATRILVIAPAILYGALLLLALLCFRFIGEQNLTVTFLLYLPRVLFLLPAAILLPLVLLVDRRIAILLFAACLAFFFFGMGWQLGATPEPLASAPGRSLTVLTYNRGQHAQQSLQPFKNQTDPDIIILQEARGRARGYSVAEGYEKFTHTIDEGEFTLLSRYPILGARSVEREGAPGAPPRAARFEIDFEGTRIALFAVHTESPRDVLLYYRQGAFLWGVLGLPGTPFAEKRKSNQVYWNERIAEARELRDTFASDPIPVLVAGDFNAPAGGYIHGLFLEEFADAHRSAGSGFGYTFPGTTRNPLSGGGPWMRIDYLFCNDAWTANWCITESGRPSQHRAVTAQFRLIQPPSTADD